jgi:transcriptional regulator with GAF, ATPase, and Fis domain
MVLADVHHPQVPLESVLCTQELSNRPARPPDFEALTCALVTLAQGLATSPKQILQQLVETALDLCQAQSAGISLLEEENGRKIFRWHALAGQYTSHLWGTTPREFSPCGTVLDTDTVQLMSQLDRHFSYFAEVEPRIAEALLVPFHVGGVAVGTVWVVSHDQTRQFDAGDARVMSTLAEFAAAAYQALSETLALKSLVGTIRKPFLTVNDEDTPRERDPLKNRGKEIVDVRQNFEEIIGSSTAIKRVMGQVEVVAPTDATVLILGETGTGKELIARAVHRVSHRRNSPFITLNCAAIPTGLLESELFGYERGAFTGALSQKIGRFELAHRGTLFLDEVGDIPLDLQPKLLRALQEKTFERLGGTKTIPIDVRLVAATNRDLNEMMREKLFRSDLYYRLMVFPIVTPPLRDHPEDIPILVRHFAKKYAAKMDRNIDNIPVETMRALMNWPWPGNVRELENFMERSVILSRGSTLRAPLAELHDEVGKSTYKPTLEQVERDYILRAFREAGGVISVAATRLGVPRTTLNAKLKRLAISRSTL